MGRTDGLRGSVWEESGQGQPSGGAAADMRSLVERVTGISPLHINSLPEHFAAWTYLIFAAYLVKTQAPGSQTS